MRSIGVSRFVFPIALAHSRHIGKENRRGFENTRLRGLKIRRWRVAVVNQLGGNVGCVLFSHPTILPLDFPLFH